MCIPTCNKRSKECCASGRTKETKEEEGSNECDVAAGRTTPFAVGNDRNSFEKLNETPSSQTGANTTFEVNAARYDKISLETVEELIAKAEMESLGSENSGRRFEDSDVTVAQIVYSEEHFKSLLLAPLEEYPDEELTYGDDYEVDCSIFTFDHINDSGKGNITCRPLKKQRKDVAKFDWEAGCVDLESTSNRCQTLPIMQPILF